MIFAPPAARFEHATFLPWESSAYPCTTGNVSKILKFKYLTLLLIIEKKNYEDPIPV